MRLIFKKWDSAFDPIVTVLGVLFVFVGGFGMALWRHVLQHPILLVFVAIPTMVAVMGVLIVVREVQLFRQR